MPGADRFVDALSLNFGITRNPVVLAGSLWFDETAVLLERSASHRRGSGPLEARFPKEVDAVVSASHRMTASVARCTGAAGEIILGVASRS